MEDKVKDMTYSEIKKITGNLTDSVESAFKNRDNIIFDPFVDDCAWWYNKHLDIYKAKLIGDRPRGNWVLVAYMLNGKLKKRNPRK